MPQTECPAQEEAWRSTTERTPGAFAAADVAVWERRGELSASRQRGGVCGRGALQRTAQSPGRRASSAPSAVWWMPACGTETSRARATCISG